MKKKIPTILIIFGISGDLTKRYLLPAIEKLSKAKKLSNKFKIVGITRQNHPDLYQMDVENKGDYEKLNEYLKDIEKDFNEPAQRLFYLVVPPNASKNIIKLLGESNFNKNKKTKILLEKPFGTNFDSAQSLVEYVGKYFKPKQLYLVDHYLAKEAVNEIFNFRSKKSVEKNWDNNFIENIEIVASEKLGIEGRSQFYEQTGALRDFVQSHLLEILSLVLMRMPTSKIKNIPILRLKALKDLYIICDITKKECVKRAQYEGYRVEVGNKDTKIETFVSLNLSSKDKRWIGIPIKLVTGKKLKEKFTKINIKTKRGLIVFDFKEKENSLGAYAQVLLGAINSDHDLFVTNEEVLESWRILRDIQDLWEKNQEDISIYKAGSSYEEIS